MPIPRRKTAGLVEPPCYPSGATWTPHLDAEAATLAKSRRRLSDAQLAAEVRRSRIDEALAARERAILAEFRSAA